MTTGEKIAKLRKENNYTQEQLAELLSVSRQSVSKYESGLAYPETEKLIKLSELFDCSVDYLLKDYVETKREEATASSHHPNESASLTELFISKMLSFDKKSEKTIFGMPLWHIGKNAKGFLAIGIRARGIISIGFLSIGILSLGLLSIGLLAFGVLAIGLLAAGCISLGGIACGAICIGILTAGAIAIGEFSMGALSIGHYFAYGDYASAMFAFGKTQANGTIFETLQNLSPDEKHAVIEQLYQQVPRIYHWIIKILTGLL